MQSILKQSGPLVMGILNATPDSFSDGGKYHKFDDALQLAEQMIIDGVDVIDVGGESTRPGAKAVGVNEELDRVIPLVESIANMGKAVSVDTSKAEVMQAAISAGASMINDVRALTEANALEVVSKSSVEVCLMHMQGQPRSMQLNPKYDDVVSEVAEFLKSRVNVCIQHGIAKERICLDPGIGFGKTLEHNCQLLKNQKALSFDELPILIGLSRKKFLGQILDIDTKDRMVASVAAGLIALTKGAKILRVHDVKETRQAINVFKVIERQ